MKKANLPHPGTLVNYKMDILQKGLKIWGKKGKKLMIPSLKMEWNGKEGGE